MTTPRRAALVLLGALLWAVLLPGAAQAHPLGNFTVNHYDGLTLTPRGVVLRAVIDRAEIPTAQELQRIGSPPGAGQLRAAAGSECATLSRAVHAAVGGGPVGWRRDASSLELRPGAAGLPTLRLTCDLRGDADLSAATTVDFQDDYLTDRVGWREITAVGEGIRLVRSPVPATSVTHELRSYPRDLLTSPVDVRSFTVSTAPGRGGSGAARAVTPTGDPFSTAMAALDRHLESVIGGRGLTPLAGTLAVLLAVLLGSGHALLPGHGKTVMAAYLAGRRGRPRDALTVGATVTLTHTAGVLVLGLAVSVSSSLAGDQVLRWLGVVSGLLVAGIGAAMLRTAAVRARTAGRATAPGHVRQPALATAAVASHVTGHRTGEQPDEHEHEHGHTHEHGHEPAHSHGPGRGGLVGMGVAGGLVPSPSALIVLLASVGLGRTAFGVVLVLAYGAGMAATLTTVGLALVRLRGRLERRVASPGARRGWAFVTRAAPLGTAALVLVVGLTLVVRGALLT